MARFEASSTRSVKELTRVLTQGHRLDLPLFTATDAMPGQLKEFRQQIVAWTFDVGVVWSMDVLDKIRIRVQAGIKPGESEEVHEEEDVMEEDDAEEDDTEEVQEKEDAAEVVDEEEDVAMDLQ